MIKGRADIIRQSDQGTDIIDVKTGTPPTAPMIRQYRDIQLGLYLWMMQTHSPTSAPIQAHYYLKHNQLKSMIDSQHDDFHDFFNGFKARIHDLIQGISSGQFLPEHHHVTANQHANQCRQCDYYGLCHNRERHQR
jgi:RecB family exonuclease